MRVKIRRKYIKSLYVNPTHQKLPKMHIEVSKSYRDLEPGTPPEEVIAIFESTVFLVCTRERGVENSLPYFFAREDIRRVEEME
ncbi:MAG: hypothetical protein JSU69_01980 [Candidatus Zixiibacteriota bacterium]|nr:MAG: hypothetical protein JSU69_01980 [candidate division Zixibacteria bacterium]